MKYIDSLLNKITMYRLVVYGLILLSAAGIILASLGRISLSLMSMLVSLALLLVVSYLTDWTLAKIWQAPHNQESWLITALIIFLILRPPRNVAETIVTSLVAMVGIASKYILAHHAKHIFNPAALAATFASLTTLQTVSWWVGNSAMWPLTLLFGLAVVRKIRRFSMVVTFVLISLVLQLVLIIHAHPAVGRQIQNTLVASPLIFLSTIMLTEPATMPPNSRQRIIFAGLIAVLYIEAWKIGPIYIYPEVALLLGNIYAFLVSPKFRAKLRLKEIQKISDQVYNFVFQPDRKFQFLPGQYMELTLAGVAFDGRGNRRTFTIASSPTEETVQVGVKFYNPSSTFKYAMSRLKPGDSAYASQLAGSFTLKGNENKKLVFIAGGIGITPFRSMVKYITDQNIKADIVIIYIVGRPEELAYKNEFLAAKNLGVRFIPVLSRTEAQVPGLISTKLSPELISWAAPDYEGRIFYISGPDAMVRSARQMLRGMKLSGRQIKTDYFSGY